MAAIKVGGQAVELPVINVKTMRRVLPLVDDMQRQALLTTGAGDADALVGLALKVLATWLVGTPKQDPALSKEETSAIWDSMVEAKAEELDDQMYAGEFTGLQPDLMRAMIEQGFFTPGEAEATGKAASPGA